MDRCSGFIVFDALQVSFWLSFAGSRRSRMPWRLPRTEFRLR
jgi:hypothetical protein